MGRLRFWLGQMMHSSSLPPLNFIWKKSLSSSGLGIGNSAKEIPTKSKYGILSTYLISDLARQGHPQVLDRSSKTLLEEEPSWASSCLAKKSEPEFSIAGSALLHLLGGTGHNFVSWRTSVLEVTMNKRVNRESDIPCGRSGFSSGPETP